MILTNDIEQHTNEALHVERCPLCAFYLKQFFREAYTINVNSIFIFSRNRTFKIVFLFLKTDNFKEEDTSVY